MKRLLVLLASLLVMAVLFQSFQCSSRNITTAKVKMKSQQYDEAIESLNKEIEMNPKSAEAYALLADINFVQKNRKEAAKNALKSLEYSQDPNLTGKMKDLVHSLWIDCYNTGLNQYGAYLSNKNAALLDSALVNFEIGHSIRPEFLEFINLKATVYELKNDQENALKEYTEYMDKFDKNYKFGVKNGLYKGLLRQDMLDNFSKFGLTKSMPGLNQKGDSTSTDIFKVDEKDAFIYSEVVEGKFVVVGWKFDPPQHWLPSERVLRTDLNLRPVDYLAQHYYFKKDYDNALKYIKIHLDLDPTNAEVYAMMVNVYQELGKTEEAIKTIETLIEGDPKNTLFITQLADLYHNLQRFDDAIGTYEKALSFDPNFDRAHRNLASAYKNRASLKQRAEQDKKDNDKNYKIDPEAYLPDLRSSAKHFSKSLESKNFENDMVILSELANIYQVLDEQDNLKKIVRNLEAIEMSLEPDKLEQYYLNMLRIYSEMGDTDKLEAVKKKME
ncbi:MAG: tetratricopeptide repeat protein [Candidatus Kapaibacterium sp.]|jgi:tetratricopeptide (TPR) repeat protein|nr:tetratricopeptide repeat protein [Candidatus Kapabacteria bacterium]